MQDMVLAVMLLICLISDLKERKIYNIVLLPALLFGLINNLATGGWLGLLQSLLGFALGLSILIIPFAMGGMGAGDVKLLAVIGAIKGPLFVFYSALGMGLAGGIIAFAILIYQGTLLTLIVNFCRSVWLMLISGFKVIAFHYDNEKIMFPYGLAIVVGTIGAFWWMR